MSKPKRRTLLRALRAGLGHLSLARFDAAIIGKDFEHIAPQVREITNPEQVEKDFAALLSQERERSAETRRRSDQLLGRIIAVLPLAAGAIVLATKIPAGVYRIICIVLGSASALLLTLSLLAVLGNLGKEAFYEPIYLGDLVNERGAAPMPQAKRLFEIEAAIKDRDRRNNVAIDRLHTSYAALVLGVLIGVIVGVLVLLSLT